MEYTKKKNKIYVITECPYVGIFQAMNITARELNKIGFEIYFILPKTPRNRYGETQKENEKYLSKVGKIIYTPMRRSGYYLIQDIFIFKKLLEKIKPDILISYTEYAGKICRILYKNKNIKNYFHAPQCIDVTRKNTILKQIREYIFERLLANRADYYLSCGPSESFLLNKTYKIPTKKIILCPNFKIKTDTCAQEKKYDFIYIGRIVKNKGIFKILKTVNLNGLTNKLIVVGEGDELEKLKIKYPSVNFTGRVKTEDVYKYIKQAKFYLSDSKIEGLPYALIEAMSVGTVPIISDVKGHKDLIINGYNGFLFKNELELINIIFKSTIVDDTYYQNLQNASIKTSEKLIKTGIKNLNTIFKKYD